ncbi:hypothetical protein AAGG74_14925 [Bacillus mexicanus]|uniref:hypothetical protein n=1 Tax=Bacillus mexicanus TaxID=2834415 RepID=UPI003D258755
MYLNLLPGDLIVNEWDEKPIETLASKHYLLEKSGYVFESKDEDRLNVYFNYQNKKNKDIIRITFCRREAVNPYMNEKNLTRLT